MADIKGTQTTLASLNSMGIRLAIDDFGTGYSSLAYLSVLPVQELKVDQSFVRKLRTQSQDQAIVALIIGMAHSMGLDVVCEGVEDEETWALLELFGADQAQGYYLSRPLPPEAILAPSITWSERLSVHVPEIDVQHQNLIALINELHEAMNLGKGAEVLRDILGGLLAYTRIHFATEEQLMREHTYAGHDEHKAAHDAFTEHVNATLAIWTRGQAIVTLQLAYYLRDWLANHIQGMDKRLGDYLSAEAIHALHEPRPLSWPEAPARRRSQ